jgi:hypothetical protein
MDSCFDLLLETFLLSFLTGSRGLEERGTSLCLVTLGGLIEFVGRRNFDVNSRL